MNEPKPVVSDRLVELDEPEQNGNKPHIQEASPAEILSNIDTRRVVTVDDVERGLKTITLKSIARSYYVTYPDGKTSPVIEFAAEDQDGREWLFRMKTLNLKVLKEKVGDDSTKWQNLRIRLYVAGAGRMKYVTFDVD